jgi:hypothetical protein
MKFSKYNRAIIYPLALWLVFELIAFGFGFTPYPNITKACLLSDTSPLFLSIMFGLWIGGESTDAFNKASAARNAIIVAFVIGMVINLLMLSLISNSPVFLTYVTSVYTNNLSVQTPILNLSLSTWIGNIFVTSIAALAGFTLVSKLKKK